MEDRMLEVLDPSFELGSTGGGLSPRLDSLSEKTLGVIWNGRLPGDQIVQQATSLLQQQYGVASVVVRKKPFIGNVAPDEIFEEMEKTCHAVITGVGD